MPRNKSDAPAYRYHISGQARVTLDGKDFFLGEYDSPQSRARYYALLSEYSANGKRAPVTDSVRLANTPISVRCVTAEFREYVEVKFAKNESHRRRFINLCTLLDDRFGDLPADEFGPRRLNELRALFVVAGNNRRYTNSQVRSICTIFKYAISRELVDVNVLIRLQTLEPLRYGQTSAGESKRRMPVDLETVKATCKSLSPTIVAMIRVQVATGMRPAEVMGMRPCDIDKRADGVWIYRPEQHKTAHHGKSKAVPIVGDARLALTPYMDREPNAFCFSPKESAEYWRTQRRNARKTPDNYGNKPGSNLKENPARKAGDRFTKDSYRRAINRACEKAGVPKWTPYQLRYNAATAVREALGVEAAQALLGHSHATMTEHYAKQSETKAIEAANAITGLGA